MLLRFFCFLYTSCYITRPSLCAPHPLSMDHYRCNPVPLKKGQKMHFFSSLTECDILKMFLSLFRWLFNETTCTVYAFCGVLFGLCSLTNLMVLSCVCWLKVCCPNYGKKQFLYLNSAKLPCSSYKQHVILLKFIGSVVVVSRQLCLTLFIAPSV